MTLAEPLAVTLLVVEALESLGVRYVIGGSLASSVHGVFRASVDADIVAELELDQVERLARELRGAFYLDEAVDVFIPKGRAFDAAQLERRAARVIATAPERTAFIASAEDTVLAKLDWYRAGGEVSERQWRDVAGVLRVQRGRLDTRYLREMAASLGVSGLLDRALAEAEAAG